jgi:hypothetical protein
LAGIIATHPQAAQRDRLVEKLHTAPLACLFRGTHCDFARAPAIPPEPGERAENQNWQNLGQRKQSRPRRIRWCE